MLFNSLDYFIFLPIVLGLYFVLPLVGRQVLLLAASLFFYMYWRVPYVALLLFSSVVDYWVARAIDASQDARRRKHLLWVSLAVNLGVLGFFKYYNFFLDSLHTLGLRPEFLSASTFLLPLGISFYTFQTMSYTIDVYRRRMPAEKSFLRVALYVALFPQLVAGPIERATNLIPQLATKQRFEWDNLVIGSRRILCGLVKKVVIADNIAWLVNTVYADPESHSSLALLLATYGFAIQIFCDFSGYSDIAIGTARTMGFRFMENFDSPYISCSIQEFWRRWHISLSTWLRDYLYISLGGNRNGSWMTYRNLMLTMLLGGLWHGASWNFIIWGAIHGVWLATERFVTRREGRQVRERPLWSPVSLAQVFLVFHGVCLAWVFFRAQTLADSIAVVTRIASFSGGSFPQLWDTARVIAVVALGSFFFVITAFEHRSQWAWWLGGVYAAVLIVLFGAQGGEFIYFVF